MPVMLHTDADCSTVLQTHDHPLCIQEHWPLYEGKMREAGLSDAAIGAFKGNYDQLVAGATGLVRGSSRQHD